MRPPAAGGLLGDARGLSAAGAVLLGFALGLAGAVVDVSTGTGLRTAFAICFLLGCIGATTLVHHEDLMATVVMPPLLFVVLAAVASVLDKGGGAGSWLTRRVFDVVTTMVTSAPVLFWAFGATLAVAVLRFVAYRASLRRRRVGRAPSHRSGQRPPQPSAPGQRAPQPPASGQRPVGQAASGSQPPPGHRTP